MKNIHVLPTDKPSRLLQCLKVMELLNKEWLSPIGNVNRNIYITSDEEIKEGDWVIDEEGNIVKADKDFIFNCSHEFDEFWKKIILTTDQSLDGVQTIDDEFLEWFVKNPSCEEVEVGYGWIRLTETDNEGYWVSIPDKQFEMQQEEPKQETLEEASYNYAKDKMNRTSHLIGFIEGAKWQEQQTIEEVFEWLTTHNYLTDLKKTLIENFKNK